MDYLQTFFDLLIVPSLHKNLPLSVQDLIPPFLPLQGSLPLPLALAGTVAIIAIDSKPINNFFIKTPISSTKIKTFLFSTKNQT